MQTPKLHLLTIVVQRKLGKTVIDAALAAGAAGATYFAAQGTGVRQKLGRAGYHIDPEKQMIFVVAEPERAEQVLAAVTEAGKLTEPGHGFAYVQEVLNAIGFTAPQA